MSIACNVKGTRVSQDRSALQQAISIDTAQLFQALNSYAGRIASTDDPKAHQKAGEILQRDLRKSRIKA